MRKDGGVDEGNERKLGWEAEQVASESPAERSTNLQLPAARLEDEKIMWNQFSTCNWKDSKRLTKPPRPQKTVKKWMSHFSSLTSLKTVKEQERKTDNCFPMWLACVFKNVNCLLLSSLGKTWSPSETSQFCSESSKPLWWGCIRLFLSLDNRKAHPLPNFRRPERSSCSQNETLSLFDSQFYLNFYKHMWAREAWKAFEDSVLGAQDP